MGPFVHILLLPLFVCSLFSSWSSFLSTFHFGFLFVHDPYHLFYGIGSACWSRQQCFIIFHCSPKTILPWWCRWEAGTMLALWKCLSAWHGPLRFYWMVATVYRNQQLWCDNLWWFLEMVCCWNDTGRVYDYEINVKWNLEMGEATRTAVYKPTAMNSSKAPRANVAASQYHYSTW